MYGVRIVYIHPDIEEDRYKHLFIEDVSPFFVYACAYDIYKYQDEDHSVGVYLNWLVDDRCMEIAVTCIYRYTHAKTSVCLSQQIEGSRIEKEVF